MTLAITIALLVGAAFGALAVIARAMTGKCTVI